MARSKQPLIAETLKVHPCCFPHNVAEFMTIDRSIAIFLEVMSKSLEECLVAQRAPQCMYDPGPLEIAGGIETGSGTCVAIRGKRLPMTRCVVEVFLRP